MTTLLAKGAVAILLFAHLGDPVSMRDLIHEWVTDRTAIERFHDLPLSTRRAEVLGVFYSDWLRRLDGIDVEALDRQGGIDWHLLRGEIRYRQRELVEERRERERIAGLLPFAQHVLVIEEGRRRLERADGRSAAGWLAECSREVKRIRGRVEKALERGESRVAESRDGSGGDGFALDAEAALRAADVARELKRVLETWHGNVAAYDPAVAWWVATPYQAATTAIDDYATFLAQKVAKATGEDADPLLGRPIGREALVSALEREWIAYAPEDLIAIATRHSEWCVEEMKRAAAEMGLHADWKRAIEQVKTVAVDPGKQGDLVASLAREAIAFCDQFDLVTIPPLCRETWRVDMISSAGQRQLPFASYGGLGVNVAYPTSDMDHERKLMAMRGNNVHFSRLVTPHELVPGHHLQRFVAARSRPWRREFSTSFHVEGWAVYGEMLFYRLGFPKGPEDRIGALLWRLHRAARIIVSLRYHLGDMAPPAMVDFLVDQVGLERDGARAEVRRYLRGGYGPLYQCGYLVGALQIWRLREEMNVGKAVSERAFHDALLSEGPIPVELARMALSKQVITRDTKASWRFGN
jgi:hypothetical protein